MRPFWQSRLYDLFQKRKQIIWYLIADLFLDKAELLLLKLIHLFDREVLLVKELEIEETKTT